PNVSTPQALAVPYPDSVGYCTFGYGYLIAKKACSDLDKPYKDAWRTVTKPTDAMALFYSYTYSQNQKVAAVLPQGVPLTQNQLDALDDWVYNVGTTAFTTPPSQVLTDLEYTNTDSQVQNTVRYLEAPRFFFRIITAKSKVSCDAIQRRADDYYMFTQGKYTNTGYYGCFYLTHIYRSSAGPGSPWGPVGGGDVTLTGDPHDPFTGPVTVWFDGDPVTVTGNNQTTLTVKMPAHVVEGAQTTGNTGFIVATSGQRPANCTQAQTGCGYTPPPLALMELPPPTATATQIKIFNSGTVAPGFCYLGPAGTQTNPPPYQQCVTATSTGQTVTLKWAAPPTGAPAITSYTIQRGTAPNAQGDKNPHGETTVKTITCGSSPNPCSTLTYSDKPGNGTFYYTVTATDANDHTNVSNQVKATLPAPGAAGAPAASNPQPQLRRARPRASAGTGTPVVQLSWTVPADGGSPVTGYDILRGTTSGGETYLTSTDPAQTSYVDTSVTAGTTYYYQVVAVNAVGDSPPSNEVTAVPYMATPPQPPPLSATSGNHSVQLSWSAPADGGLPVTGYNIYRGTVSGGETYFDSVPASATSYTDDTVTGGITYYYQVTATNLLGESQPSNEVSVTPTGPGPCPLTSNQVIWTGGAGTNDWADGANWSTGSQPGPSANVCIPATSLSSISSTGNVTVNSVDTSTPLSLGVGGAYPTFTIAGTASESYFHADVTVGSGEVFTLDDTAVVDSSATFSIQGVAALEGTGDLDITSTATLDWTPGCSPDVCAYWTGGTITNQGTTDLTGDVIVDGGTLFDNTGTLVVGGGTQFAGTATSEVLSTGTVTGACGTTTMECSVEGDLRLNGPVQADTGELILAEDGSTPQEGVFSVAAGASLEFAGSGTTSFTAPAPISGAGTLILAGATVNLTGTISVPEVQVTGGTTNLDTSLAVPLLDLQQGTLAGSGPVTVASGGTFTQAGGSLSGAVDLTIQSGGTLDWADGEQQGSGTTLVDAGATAALTQDSVTLGDTRQFTNNGTLTQTADIVVEGGTATNGGSWAINGGYGYADNGDTWAGSAFTNTGTLTVAAGTGTATVGLFPTNSGTVTVQSGTLALENDQEGTTATSTGSFTVAASATLDFTDNGSSGFDLTSASSVTGTGTVTMSNYPAVTVDGTFTIANITQAEGDVTLNVPITPATYTLGSGTLAGSGSVTIPSGGTFTQAGGSLSGAVDLTIQNGGTLNWQNGEEQGSGSTLVASGATAQIFQSQAELGDTRQFTN
ncbi:MAG TPA: fibronectin type III domain-containing protein, partial [Pseudonocardiaceae bacterium]|nr:fibronectin type III domain-containing protein [Pseudonocardiaceae bacterium]